MTPDELSAIIDRLRKQGNDDAEVEAKRCADKLQKDVWESVSAFGNTHGGVLILGLDEEMGFRPAEKFNIDAVLDAFVTGIGDGGADNRKMENPPQYEIERHELEGKPLLVIELQEVDPRLKPCFILSRGVANGSYKRVDDKDVKLSPVEIFELQHSLVVSDADRRVVPGATVRDFDENLVDQLVSEVQRRNSKALRGVSERSDQLVRLNATNFKGEVLLAGLLTLGTYPQQYFPKCVVDVAVHPDTEKSKPDGPRFIDRKVCEGPVSEVIDDAIDAVARNLRRYSVVEGRGRKDELEIPEEVLREALANAVVHREYGEYFLGQAISVDVYPDRVEVINPGGLWGGKTLETLADGTSCCRNPALMSLMSYSSLPHGKGFPVEGNGSGIPFMIREMTQRALDAPRFVADVDQFTVILGRGGTEIVANRAWLKSTSSRSMGRHEEAALLIVKRKGTASVHEVRDELKIDSDEVRDIFAALIEDGLVEESGEDAVKLAQGSDVVEKTDVRESILDFLERCEPATLKEIAEALGRSPASVRYHINKLIAEGDVEPTAPPTSRKRKYVLAKRGE